MIPLKLLPFLVLFSISLQAQYHNYADESNLFDTRAIVTSDDGFLIVSPEFCYTPGSLVIEGCIYAFYLVKTNDQGDTLWTRRVPYYTQYGPDLEIYENVNGTYTFTMKTNQNYSCDGISVGLSGFQQVQIYNFDANGNQTGNTLFPVNCALELRDVIRLDNGMFAVCAYYDRPVFLGDEGKEGRLFMMDKLGNISQEITFPATPLEDGRLYINSAGELQMTYLDLAGAIYLRVYDQDFNFLRSSSNTSLANTCLDGYTRYVKAGQMQNEDFVFLCHRFGEEFQNTHFYRFDNTLNLIAEKTYTLKRPTNFIEDSNGEIFVASTNETADTVKNTQVTTLSPAGDSISSFVIYSPKEEEPSQMIPLANDKYAIVGQVNCCNLDSMIGPGQSFLWLESIVTSLEYPLADADISVAPNPAIDYLNIAFTPSKNSTNTFHLYSATGQLLLKKTLNDSRTKMDIGHLSEGVYFYNLLQNGKVLKSGKTIKISR